MKDLEIRCHGLKESVEAEERKKKRREGTKTSENDESMGKLQQKQAELEKSRKELNMDKAKRGREDRAARGKMEQKAQELREEEKRLDKESRRIAGQEDHIARKQERR